MAVSVVESECPVAAAVPYHNGEVEAVIEGELIIVDGGLQKHFFIPESAATRQIWILKALGQQREAIAGVSGPKGVDRHFAAYIPVGEYLYGVAVVEACRIAVASVAVGKLPVGPGE